MVMGIENRKGRRGRYGKYGKYGKGGSFADSWLDDINCELPEQADSEGDKENKNNSFS